MYSNLIIQCTCDRIRPLFFPDIFLLLTNDTYNLYTKRCPGWCALESVEAAASKNADEARGGRWEVRHSEVK